MIRSFNMKMNIDFRLLKAQKLIIIDMMNSANDAQAAALEGVVSLFDSIQDEAWDYFNGSAEYQEFFFTKGNEFDDDLNSVGLNMTIDEAEEIVFNAN